MFKTGDKVIATIDYPSSNSIIRKGDTGVILMYDEFDELQAGVRWDKSVGGHSLDGLCESGHGWWVNENHIQIYEEMSFKIDTESFLNLL